MRPFRDFENKKLQQLVEKAWDLFWQFGFTRVSIEEVCKEAGVSKMTFYKHFKNKNDLGRFIMKEMSEYSLKLYDGIMSEDIPFVDKIRKSVELKIEQTENISEAFFRDFHRQNDPELNKVLQEQRLSNLRTVTDWYLKAQKEGDIRRDIKPEFIVYFLNHMIEMVNDDKLVGMYEHPGELIKELTNFFFYGLLPAEKR
jgi:AcrR family transcriptional regulator